MNKLVPEDPPTTRADKGARSIWQARLQGCVDEPKRWFKVGQHAEGVISQLKQAPHYWPDGMEFEFTGRRTDARKQRAEKGKTWVYARCMGPRTTD